MKAYEIREDESELLRLVHAATAAEPLVLVSKGEPLAEVTPLGKMSGKPGRRLGFMQGEIEVPNDFDHMFADEIAAVFEGGA